MLDYNDYITNEQGVNLFCEGCGLDNQQCICNLNEEDFKTSEDINS